MKHFAIICLVLPVGFAAPAVKQSPSPTVFISYPKATIVGIGGDIEKFPGIPFAHPPTGPLRLKPPKPLTDQLGIYNAVANGAACPQFVFSTAINDAIPTSEIGLLADSPLFQKALNINEDCLTINIHRPAGTTASSNLPVLFWIFGGGFEIGWNSMYDGAPWVTESVKLGQPVIFVTVNYRVGGFGFMPGKEILADGSSNLGLLDQRLGLEWVADNIEAFGGNPDKVTIWGESAGAISVFDQMSLYDGNITYKGRALFRGAIMNSGSIIPADPVDCPKGQTVYDTVVAAAGCSAASDTLNCLRDTDYSTFLNASNSVPGLLSYHSVALSYLPRPDGKVMTTSPELLVAQGKYAKVPFIIGDQEDEGTLFALFQSNIKTTDQLIDYLSTIFFHDADRTLIAKLVGYYSDIETNGSPFRTGPFNNWYPQFKRLAAILGDLVFSLTRRGFLQVTNAVNPSVPSWSYMSSYDYGTPILGTFHGSDLLQVFFGIWPNYASSSFHAYYISFVNNLDPNVGHKYPKWPKWAERKQLLNSYPAFSTFIKDDFREDTLSFLLANLGSFRI